MSNLEQFEHSLPRIKPNIERIAIETAGGFAGSFMIENIGGSELAGTITSNSRAVVFSPEAFCGNCVEISYMLNLDIYRPGDVVTARALVLSNGGEVVIPVEIRIVPPVVTTRDGVALSSLDGFLRYAQEYPVAARQLFTQPDFMAWLINMGYEHMEMYEHFTRDPNKERALDHFLILNKLKEKAAISVAAREVRVDVKPGAANGMGALYLQRSSWGYTDVTLAVPEDASWLRLGKTRVSSADFIASTAADGAVEVFFIAIASALTKRRQSARVAVLSEGGQVDEVCITAVRLPAVIVSASKETFGYEDKGSLRIQNNTDGDLMLEIMPNDSFLKFEGKKYLIGAKAEIPFTIQFGGLRAMQASARKRVAVVSEINVRARVGDRYEQEKIRIQLSGLA